MTKKFRPTKKQAALLQTMKGGGKLCFQHQDPPYFIDGGDAVNQRTVKTLLRNGLLKPAGDGLLPGDTQTLVVA